MFAITIFVPVTHAAAIRAALAASGAGKVKCYDSASFSCAGTGRFRPLEGAHPAIGTIGVAEDVAEERVETEVRADVLPAVLRAVKAAHPYEAPAIHVVQLLDWEALALGTSVSAAASATSSSISSGVPAAGASARGFSVLIEGLDGTGKSTLCAELCRRLDAAYVRTPPDSMRAYREYFDAAGGAMREAYYMVGNFAAGADVHALCAAGKTVVMDRYYTATKSYILGRRVEPLPPRGDAAYAWPPALHRPTHCFLLMLPEEQRLARRAGRIEIAETEEEAALRLNPEVAARVNEAYRRFGCIEISAEGGVGEVADRVLAALAAANTSGDGGL